MVPTERVVMQFFILTLFTINGLHCYPRHHPSLGILNELIGQDSKTPLIVVVDSNNQARTLDDEQDPGQRISYHAHNPDHHSAKFSDREYENALYEILRTSENMLNKQLARSSKNKTDKSKGKKKDSCEADNNNGKQEFLAEQCSQSEESCGNFD